MDIISRLPGCARQAADEVSAYTQVKKQDAPTLLIPKSECPGIWIRLPETQMAKIIVQYGRSSLSSWAKSAPSSFGGTIVVKCKSRKFYWNTTGKNPNWECLFFIRGRRLFLFVYVDDIKLTEKKQNINPTLKIIIKKRWLGTTDIILWQRLSGLHSKRLSHKQRCCRQKQKYVGIQDYCWDYRQKLPHSEKHGANISSWFYDLEGHAKKCVERYCELANKTTQRLYKVSTPCLDDHQIKEDEMGSVGFYGYNWTKACDKRSARLISHSHHTCEFKQYCCVGNTAQHCRLGLFQDSDFAGDFEDSKSTSGSVLCIFGSRTFVPVSWRCKKHPSVRMDGNSRCRSLGLGDWSISLFTEPKPKDIKSQGNLLRNNKHNRKKIKHVDLGLSNVDHVSSNVRSSRTGAILYVIEDIEAVIKMIIKGRSPTMRHVSRTHRVALDWLFERINLDPKIQIRYIDTKHQLADILTK